MCGHPRVKDMYYHVNEGSGQKAPLIADDVYEIIMKVFSTIMHGVAFMLGLYGIICGFQFQVLKLT